MALDAGNNDCTSGLSKRCYDKVAALWLANFGWDLTAQTATVQQQWKDVFFGLSEAVVEELEANAELDSAVATIETTDSGLQRDADGANPDCLGPSAQKTLTVTGGIT